MRQVVLDTETTGLEPTQGHRVIEIGCVEVINRRRTEAAFHQYINPQRDVEDGAYEVHGLSNEFLSDKPLFRDVAQDFINFVRDAELIIHNAPFDVSFINAELANLGPEWGRLEDYCSIVDSLKIARELHPGQKNNLDALCTRYSIDNSQRDVHGALLDAQLLLDVYLSMTGGQTSLSLEDEPHPGRGPGDGNLDWQRENISLSIFRASAEEAAAHEKFLDRIEQETGTVSIWRTQEGSGARSEE